MQNRFLPLILGASLFVSATAAQAFNTPFDTGSQGVRTVAVFGDSPYGTTSSDMAQTTATAAFIDSINADREVSLALHVGDIHSGSQYCTEAYNRTVYDLWTRFQVPLVYTPGDNEWTDCHKAKEGGGTYNPATRQIDYKLDADGHLINYRGGDPVSNLDLVRRIFFANPGYSLGAHKLVQSQAQVFDRAHPTDANYVENVMWEQSNILFATLNIPGGSNNDSDIWYGAPSLSDRQMQERSERTAADLRWLEAAFARAQEDDAKALVLQTQADMWDLDGKAASHLTQYRPFVDRIATLAKTFGKPVLLFNGDSHLYRSDNPLKANAPCVLEAGPDGKESACTDDAYANQPGGYDVPNFHRITVHGSTFPLEWLKLTINPRANGATGANAFGPFSWARIKQ